MTVIRSTYSVPTPTRRRVEPAGRARGSDDRAPRQDRALAPVPARPHSGGERSRSFARALPATAEVMVQIIGGDLPRQGLKAEPSEVERFRRTYAQAAQQSAPAPKWERRA